LQEIQKHHPTPWKFQAGNVNKSWGNYRTCLQIGLSPSRKFMASMRKVRAKPRDPGEQQNTWSWTTKDWLPPTIPLKWQSLFQSSKSENRGTNRKPQKNKVNPIHQQPCYINQAPTLFGHLSHGCQPAVSYDPNPVVVG
jgi:hypothetical protein